MDYFRQFLQVAPLSISLWRTLEASQLAGIILPRPMLDIGCGFGEFAGVFFGEGVDAGVDIIARNVAKAARGKIYRKLMVADSRELPFKDAQFGSAISISVLEHIKYVDRVFSEIYRILKPGGVCVFTVPTRTYNALLWMPPPRNLWLRLFHRLFRQEAMCTTEEWLRRARTAGFRIERCVGTVSRRQVVLYELLLPLTLPSKLFQVIAGRKVLVPPSIRAGLLGRLFRTARADTKLTDANILVVAEKPLH